MLFQKRFWPALGDGSITMTFRRWKRRQVPDLAEDFGVETKAFKLNVRKLKNLGLTFSFNPGYSLSPRGEAYLERTSRG